HWAAGAGIVVALGLSGYLMSCAGGEARNRDKPPRLMVLSEQLPPLPQPPPVVAMSARPAKVDPADRLVVDVLNRGCSTVVVKALSEQIIAEGNCIQPGSYTRVPRAKNVAMGKAVFPYMRKPARDALVKAVKRGKRYNMTINSMLRTVAQQYLLFDWYQRGRCGIKLAAEPGTSNHQGGLAIDIREPGTWRKILTKQGFRWLGKKDRWHFDYLGRTAPITKGLDILAFQQLWNRNHPADTIAEDGHWSEETEAALRRAPVAGFELGPECEAEAE
ncbi:MAG TPA: hypothetical protein ENK23_00940, partial [Sorangium sp.]|nr:hypothetical protein [Sorangium sp.]